MKKSNPLLIIYDIFLKINCGRDELYSHTARNSGYLLNFFSLPMRKIRENRRRMRNVDSNALLMYNEDMRI